MGQNICQSSTDENEPVTIRIELPRKKPEKYSIELNGEGYENVKISTIRSFKAEVDSLLNRTQQIINSKKRPLKRISNQLLQEESHYFI